MTDGQLLLVLSGVFALFLFMGCSARKCPPDVAAAASRERTLAGVGIKTENAESRAIAASLESVARSAAGDLNVLVLSGGGSHGAWGAGVLKGWRKATPPRPQFQVVTGVSTGALLATHAFLGQEADDQVLETFYTTVRDGDIFKKRWFFELPFSDSLAVLDPLERLIAKVITNDVIDYVATEARSRRLYVATTNLDAGKLKVWDMTALAAAKDYARYRQVLLASSAVPALYSPVDIDGYFHSDGGVREQLLVRKVMLELARARATGVKVWVILNGQIDVDPTCVQPRLLSLAQRGVEILAAASGMGNLVQSKAVADSVGAAWYLSRIPTGIPLSFGAQEFDPEGMRLLFEWGETFGIEGTWETAVPVIEDATRVLER